MVSDDTLKVGMTGFEPATLRPPGVYATGLRHIPSWKCKLSSLFTIFKRKLYFFPSTTGKGKIQKCHFWMPSPTPL